MKPYFGLEMISLWSLDLTLVMFLLERGFIDWDANVHPSLWWQRYLSTGSSCFYLIVYVSSHAMHSGSIVSHFQRQGIALPAPHLHYVEFCPLQERPTCLTAPGNSWRTIKIKCFGVQMKTDQVTARLVSHLKCPQPNILWAIFEKRGKVPGRTAMLVQL